jgi:threonylcarbamoyladenosine tRNA methylthiotransferase MtaB
MHPTSYHYPTVMPSFYIEQFGCRATQADAAALERQLLGCGCSATSDFSTADFVVVNTCTVTAAADAQARDAIRKIHLRNPAARLIVTGCYAQRAPEELANLPGVSQVVGNSHKPQIPAIVDQWQGSPSNNGFVPATTLHSGLASADSLHSHRAKILTGDIFAQTTLLAAPVFGGENNHTRPILKIQDGCNSRCSYCVIPFVRGKSRSLPPLQVIDEIRQLADSGYREVVLSGINLGMYGRDLSPRVAFEDLLRRILDETPIQRLRISSIEPMDVTSDLIALFASTDRLARHFHMPLQSGSDPILAAMHRWYRAEHYARRAELVREVLPDAAIGADVIAGFPGETGADHAATLDFIERLPFSYLHVFSFSKRPGTGAASRTDEVPAATIQARARELRALSDRKSAAFYASQSSKLLQVLTLRHPSRPHHRVGAHFTCDPATAVQSADNEISLKHDRNGATPAVGAQQAAPHLGNIIPSTSNHSWTPAISSNYLHVRVRGEFPPNVMLSVSVFAQDGA